MNDFESVYRQYAERVYRFLLALTRDAALAEELTQDTFFKALVHIESFRGECPMEAWLCKIAKNAYFTHCRRRKRFASFDEVAEVLEGDSDVAAEAERREEGRRVRRRLAALPEPYRGVFSLRVFAELSHREIGAAYQKGEAWARVTYYRAKEKLREALSEPRREGGTNGEDFL